MLHTLCDGRINICEIKKKKTDFEKEEINEVHIVNNMHTMLNNATFELLFRGALFGPDTIIIN